MPRPRYLLGTAIALAALAAPISGCGGDDDDTDAGNENGGKPATTANPPALKG